jgi:hypothetical protein
MPGSLPEVLKLLGVTTPFIYASAAYVFFHWLDRKASGPAKRAISGWLEPREYDKAAVAAAIVELFDRVYTRPLLTWRAFSRSTIITFAVMVVSFYELVSLPNPKVWDGSATMNTAIAIFIITNLVSDYIALFVVRALLVTMGLKPFKALLVGPTVGICLVILVIAARDTFTVLITGSPSSAFTSAQSYIESTLFYMRSLDEYRAMSLAALAVHLWLPFLASCIGLLKALQYLLLTVDRMKWFIKQGKQHPLDAVGFVAAPVVFIGAVAVQILVSK